MNSRQNINTKIDECIKELNQLVQKGDLLQAIKKAEYYISQSSRNFELLQKYAFLHELTGNIEIAGLLNISLQYYFPQRFEAKVALLNFCFRNQQLKKVANKLKQWRAKYGREKQFIESEIKLLKTLWKYDEAKAITEQYIQQFPKEAFGYLQLLNISSNSRPNNYRQILESIVQKKPTIQHGFRVQRTLNQVKSTYVNTFQPDTYLQFTYHENTQQQLKSYFIKNAPEEDKKLQYVFIKPLNIRAIRALATTAIFSQYIHQKLLAYIDEHQQWKTYQLIKEYLAITTKNMGITSQPEKLHPQPNKKVDIVYAWCDNNDPNFRTKLNRLLGETVQRASSSNDKFRYQQIGEIKLSLLSVQQYFPQVNHIYIVTNQQQFDVSFLKPSFQNKIRFVDHTEIMPKNLTDRGVFNSNLIETFVWKIPGLNECFLYLNDDVILGDDLKNEHLFNTENVPFTTLIPHHFEKHKVTKDLLALTPETAFWQPCMFNAHRQFIKHFKVEPHLGPLHQIMIMTKSSCRELFNLMKPTWQQAFFKDAIRGNNSVYTVMMYNWYALLKGYQVLGPYHLYRRRSLYFHNEIYAENVATIREVKPLFYCLNYIADAISKKLMKELIGDLIS